MGSCNAAAVFWGRWGVYRVLPRLLCACFPHNHRHLRPFVPASRRRVNSHNGVQSLAVHMQKLNPGIRFNHHPGNHPQHQLPHLPGNRRRTLAHHTVWPRVPSLVHPSVAAWDVSALPGSDAVNGGVIIKQVLCVLKYVFYFFLRGFLGMGIVFSNTSPATLYNIWFFFGGLPS